MIFNQVVPEQNFLNIFLVTKSLKNFLYTTIFDLRKIALKRSKNLDHPIFVVRRFFNKFHQRIHQVNEKNIKNIHEAFEIIFLKRSKNLGKQVLEKYVKISPRSLNKWFKKSKILDHKFFEKPQKNPSIMRKSYLKNCLTTIHNLWQGSS